MRGRRMRAAWGCAVAGALAVALCLGGCSQPPSNREVEEQPFEDAAVPEEAPDRPSELLGIANGYDDTVSSYTVERAGYREGSLNEDGFPLDEVGFDISFPEVRGLEPLLQDKVNAAIRDQAMLTADKMYLEPDAGIQSLIDQYRRSDGSTSIASTVKSVITYNDERLMSIVFEDHYFAGSIFLEFLDLRTLTIDLQTGETFFLASDIVAPDPRLALLWKAKAHAKAPDDKFLKLQPESDLAPILSNDPSFANRYFSDFYVGADGGICLAVTYHLSIDGTIARGWVDAALDDADLDPYRTQSAFWDIPRSAGDA